VLDVEVVLAYRCGAVPALHRVPFSAGDERSLAASTSMDICRSVIGSRLLVTLLLYGVAVRAGNFDTLDLG
jgi:hypothetical protein